MNNFPTFDYMPIEPRLKAQQKQLDNYRKKLNITLPQEDFVLKCILSFDWNRRCIIQEIEHVRKSKGLDMVDFRVIITAPHSTTDYCCSNPFKEDGWIETIKTESDRCWAVYHKLNTYITR